MIFWTKSGIVITELSDDLHIEILVCNRVPIAYEDFNVTMFEVNSVPYYIPLIIIQLRSYYLNNDFFISWGFSI